MNNTSVDSYLEHGCGRCPRYQTPQCKVHLWTEHLVLLRAHLVAAGLTEEMKWGSPCYTVDGKNVVMLTSFNEYCALSFIQGVLLPDPSGALELAGPNTQAGRHLRFTSADQIRAQGGLIDGLLQAAIEVRRSGARFEYRAAPEPMPDELVAMLDADPVVSAAYEALTPGRRRSYVLYVSGAKQSKTREARAERSIPKILAGKGFNER